MIGLLMLANSKDADISCILNKFPSQDVIPQIWGQVIGQDKTQYVWTHLPIESKPCSKKIRP
jgi:hypothetical protein